MSSSLKPQTRNEREVYVDLNGRRWHLRDLDEEERALFAKLRRLSKQSDWNAFDNTRIKEVAALYEPRGLSRRQIINAPLYRIAQDLSGRIAVAGGYARVGDYRDELHLLIATRFKNRRAFCEATGLSEALVSHVLARRKHLSIQTLSKALGNIGFSLRITPLSQAEAS